MADLPDDFVRSTFKGEAQDERKVDRRRRHMAAFAASIEIIERLVS
jgi:hypothetical protein